MTATHLEELIPRSQALLLQRVDIVREEALDTEDASLFTCESRALYGQYTSKASGQSSTPC